MYPPTLGGQYRDICGVTSLKLYNLKGGLVMPTTKYRGYPRIWPPKFPNRHPEMTNDEAFMNNAHAISTSAFVI